MNQYRRVFRFILVGIANTAIDFILLFALTKLGMALIPANMISTAVALAFSFLVNRSFTFQATENGRALWQVMRFIVVTLIALWVLQPLVLVLLTPAFQNFWSADASLFWAKVIATVVSMTWNYLLYAGFVFKKRTPPKQNEKSPND